MSDWERLVGELPWIVEPGAAVDVGATRSWDRGAVDGLPALSALLAGASVTPVTVDGSLFELVAWGSAGRRRGWLCPGPVDDSVAAGMGVHPAHRELLTRFGGISEMFGAPESWWSPNHSDVLTVDAAALDAAGVLRDYAWIWEDRGLEMPIRAEEYYVVSVEANGNLTLAERCGEGLLLFAPDHAFEGVTELDGCPPYSLYTFDGIGGFTAWIEQNARSWTAG